MLGLIGFDSVQGVVLSQSLSFDNWFGVIQEGKSVAIPHLQSIVSSVRVGQDALLVCDLATHCVMWNAVNQSVVDTFSVSNNLLVGLNASLALVRCSSGFAIAFNGKSVCIAVGNVVSLTAALVDDSHVMVVFEAEEKKLFRAFVDLFTLSLSHVPVEFGVGSNPSLSTKSQFAVVSASDSFCWNSEFQNKEVIMFCDSQPVSQSGVLSYWKGLLLISCVSF